jgi:diguanylate cyclase (GGDEF)-like protein
MTAPLTVPFKNQLKLLAKFFSFAPVDYPNWPKVSETSKFMLFILLVILEMLIHGGWYGVVLGITASTHYVQQALIFSALINRPLMINMAVLTVAMGLFSCFSLWFVTVLPEKSKQWLYYQGLFVMVYLSYATIFSLCIGENTSVVGIMLLSGTGFGLLLLKWRYIVIAFVISIVVFVGFILSRGMLWMTSLPSFYPSVSARDHWFWGLSFSWLIIPKASLSLLTMAQVLRLLQLQRRKIYHLLEVDALTGIANRRSVYCYFNYLWQNRHHWSTVSVIYFDLDKFKQINDEYGHDAGDATLKTAAKTMARLLPKQMMCGRVGGEEFCIVLPNVGIEDAEHIAEQLRLAFAKQTVKFGMLDDEINFTASFGLVSMHQQGLSVSQSLNFEDFIDYMRNDIQTMPSLPAPIEPLLKFADVAMQDAKSRGRNCVVKGNCCILAAS